VARALEICDRLKQLGTETVTLCGGEPFMYPGLDKVVDRLHELGIKIVLYTSGTSNQFDVRMFLPYVEFLSLPVDAVSAAVIDRMRGVSQFERVSSILSTLRRVGKRPKIKVGTVVTKQNIEDLGNIGDYLHSLGIVDVWRLYEFSPYGIGKHHESRYLLGAGEFKDAVAREKLRNESRVGRTFLISERDRADNEGYCMIIDSGGSFYRYAERYIPLGITIENQPEEIIGCYDRELHLRQKAWHTSAA
jgi:MoaA/NifB/PqqE/SkfB family radical SAM enzyme